MKRAAELSLLAALGVGLAAIWSQFAMWGSDPVIGYPEMIFGTAQRPYVYRALAPLLVRGLMLAGVELYAAGAVVAAASFILWLWAMRWLAGLVGVPRPLLATVLASGPVCILFVAGGYIYDPLTLALLTLALAMAAAERWRAYVLLFPLMAVCRESAILLPIVLVLWRGWRWRLLAYQFAVLALVRLALTTIFAHNPGADVQLHWLDHVWYLWLAPKPNILALGLYGGALAASLWRWNAQPAFLRAAAIIIPAIFAVYWVLGYPGEIRVCLEAYPVLYLLAWNTTARVLGAHTRSLIARWREVGQRRQLAPS